MRWVGVLLVALFCGCEKAELQETPLELSQIPDGFEPIIYPAGNEFNLERWALGKQLFYDTQLSADGKVSCATCHQPALAFADHQSITPGNNGQKGFRNAPTLANIAWHKAFNRDGGVPTLEMQVLAPIQEHSELANNIVTLAAQLSADSAYAQQSRLAYGRNIDPFVITRAIANFERTLISANSAYDQNQLSEAAQRGKELFFSPKTGCARCHSGPDFTDYNYYNIGLSMNYEDVGRFRISKDSADIGKFKTPSLRNVLLTAPYMHDGSINTLSEVIEHYNAGGVNHPSKDKQVRPLGLTSAEKQDLIVFLNSLTDLKLIQNDTFQP